VIHNTGAIKFRPLGQKGNVMSKRQRELTLEPVTESEQAQIMLEVNKWLAKYFEDTEVDDEHQLALAGILMRNSISMYRGIITDHEMLHLFEYVIERMKDIPPTPPNTRTIN
jgi:hypothetical protein